MRHARCTFTLTLAAAAALALPLQAAPPDPVKDYPTEPVRFIAPFVPGAGGLSHLSGALLASLAGVNLVHIPYKGGALAMNDVIAGQIQILFGTLLLTNPYVKAGRLRRLAVTTVKRAPAAPEVPTMMEAGVPGYEVAQWYGILAPAKVPPAIIDKLSKEIARSLHEPDVKPRLAADGSDAVGNTPAEFGAHVRSEVAKWAKLVKQLGLKAE